MTEIIGITEEPPLVCCICHGKRYTEDTGGNKKPCGACKNDAVKDATIYLIPLETILKQLIKVNYANENIG